jgi:hypothetical protein
MRAEHEGLFRAVLFAVTAWIVCGSVNPNDGLASNTGTSTEAEYLAGASHAAMDGCAGQSLYWHNPCEFGRDPCQRDPWCLGGHQAMSPTWYFMNELMPLLRYQDSGRFQSLPQLYDDGEIVLESNDVDSGFAGGMRVLIGKSLGDWYRIEGSYFGSHSWTDSEAVRNTDFNIFIEEGNMFSPFSKFGGLGGGVGLAGVDFNTYASIGFSSSLNNAEINIRRRIGHFCGADTCDGFHRAEASFLIGLRYTKMRETFNYFTRSRVPDPTTGAFINRVNVNTDNDMLGLQLGWLSQLNIHRRSWIDFDVKGVIFANRAEQQTDYSNDVTAPFSDDDDDTVASFMVDLSLMLNYQFAHSWTLRAGYNGMFLMGAALASDNFSRNIDIVRSGPASLSHNGSVAYHGPSIALVWTR